MGPPGDDAACVVDLAVVGERKENVAQVVATVGTVGDCLVIPYLECLGGIAVEKVSATKLQFEFWFGHSGEEQRHRLHHKLEVRISRKAMVLRRFNLVQVKL